jgi:hypothetical protein
VNKERKLSVEDLLFIDYVKTDDERKLMELVGMIKPWLAGLVYTFVQSEEMTTDIIKNAFELFIINRKKFNPETRSVVYEIYLLAKNNPLFWNEK